ncbi:MAG TPA: hypothetical protein ENK44_02000, partial [Caldithrix abyssi]|nr:hypothetical protein [Caldithrix abyssi]
KLLISLGIGTLAGIIDVIPMIVKKLDIYANISAFVHWVVLGIIISYVQMPVAPWFKGLIIAELSALPIIIIVAKEDKKSILPIVIMSAVLGIGVGILTGEFAV